MKYLHLTALTAAALVALLPTARAQSSPQAKIQADAAAARAKAPAKASPRPAAPQPKLARSAQKAVEEVTPIDDDPNIRLTEADLEVAKRVFVGEMPCELGAAVKVTPSRREGFFIVVTKGYRFSMHPVESRTGAVRLEDPRRGALWLQLGNKSMLMSQKLGQRLADECQSPQQVTFAEQMKKSPQPGLLDSRPLQPTAGPGGPVTAPPEAATPPVPVTNPPVAPSAPAASPPANAAAPAAVDAPAPPPATPASASGVAR